MVPAEWTYTVFYILFSVCITFPPDEFVSAGVTVQNVFTAVLGSEDLQFVHFHIKRSIITTLVHSCLPLGYVMGIYIAGEYESILEVVFEGNLQWRLYCALASLSMIIGYIIAFLWYNNNYKRHPVTKQLAIYASGTNQPTWENVASDINNEFLRVDKLCIQYSSNIKVYITENWIIKVSPYTLNLAHHSDVVLTVIGSDQHEININQLPGRTQFLNIEVQCVREGIPQFKIRVSSLDFQDLQTKVQRPIINIQNITIHKSLSDHFLEVFRQQVAQNPTIQTHEELDTCIGCMINPASIKIDRLCNTQGLADGCVSCYCRPMWCLDCMGKWFASRQNQNHPESWLGSKCPCPTCRSRFCVLDVCTVRAADS